MRTLYFVKTRKHFGSLGSGGGGVGWGACPTLPWVSQLLVGVILYAKSSYAALIFCLLKISLITFRMKMGKQDHN